MQFMLRRCLEIMWRWDIQWTPGKERFDCPAGWAEAGEQRDLVSLVLNGSYFRQSESFSRDDVCELIGGSVPALRGRWLSEEDGSLESGFATSDADSEASDDKGGCGTAKHLEALATPIPFRARTKAALGPRLLDTLRGLRGADAELSPGWRDELEELPQEW